MTFSKNYELIFVEMTWLICRKEYLSKFKWSCYLTSKKFALTEMIIDHFDIMGLKHHHAHRQIAREERASCLSYL